ncbi:hypothetical protein JOM56_001906 [Amanita muscaria]
MGSREIPERRSSYWKKSIAEPTKHQKIEQRWAFLHLGWAVTAPNLFLVLILLTSFITPSSCTDYKAAIDDADIKLLCGAGEHDTRKGIASTYSALYKCCSDHGGLAAALSPLQTETATLDDVTKGSGPQRVDKITSELSTEETETEAAQEAFEYWVEHSGLGDEIASKLGTEKKDIKIDTAKGLLASLEPPPPPSGTGPGYNLWLDKPRPTTIEEYLR